MVQATSFLLRWLFLCRLADDRAEVQTWPYRPPGYYEPHHPRSPPQPPSHPQQQQQYGQPGHGHDGQQAQQQQHEAQHGPQHPQQHGPQHPPHRYDDVDLPTYRESVVRTLTSHPPGSTERLRALEELRLEAVRDLAARLAKADEAIRRSGASSGASGAGTSPEKPSHQTSPSPDPDADDAIREDFRRFVQREYSHLAEEGGGGHGKPAHLWQRFNFLRGHHEADSGAGAAAAAAGMRTPMQASVADAGALSVSDARALLSSARCLLPQLASAVLHSPPALLPPDVAPDPISSLRSLLVSRCRSSPSLGIALCWLLEAEVGRKWKALFEHRQRTGRRLILIVQADIAAAIAEIGAEKASAFNLLQDAEMATAFGMERRYDDDDRGRYHTHALPAGAGPGAGTGSSEGGPPSPRPPRSIGDLRCRHFGDSMHLVDRLTQISLDLRRVPPASRNSHLQMRVAELNRRLCRRMATRGRVSVDVEDAVDESGGQFPGSRPYVLRWTEDHVREDMIRDSVRFPLEPESMRWPGGGAAAGAANGDLSSSSVGGGRLPERHGVRAFEGGVVRALRILPEECRVLDSRERCPLLVRMEVVETGLDADDARLWDGEDVGTTVREALGVAQTEGSGVGLGRVGPGGGFDPCEIPPELMDRGTGLEGYEHGYEGLARGTASGDDATSSPVNEVQGSDRSTVEHTEANKEGARQLREGIIPPSHDSRGSERENKAVLSRGGYQGYGDGYYGSPDMHGTFDMAQEQYYEEFHGMRQQREDVYNSPDAPLASASSNQPSTGSDLLDQVFGRPWDDECETLRLQSPYRDVPGWRLASFIVKAGEDIRKEALVMQLMSRMWTWFREEIPPHLRPFLRPYTILCVGGDAGLVECLPDVKSVNEVKRNADGFTSLRDFFERAYGPPTRPPLRDEASRRGTVSYEQARDNFLRSLVGYSVVCYILQIKDRHNANILMDREGHIMHIDFGFVLGETPKMGKVPLFSERAPFKLSAEFWEVIGGWSAFRRFCEMFEAAYAVAASHVDEICALVEAAIVNVSRDAGLARSIADGVRGRVRVRADPREQQAHIMNIVNDAITSWGTSTYDWLQRSMHGYQ